jgi:histidine triad (HIT) family protein
MEVKMSNLYEDHLLTISLAPNPAAKGHLLITPKEPLDDLQAASNDLVEHLFFASSFAATALFELAQAQGTNIILQEHPLRVNVIARHQDDNLELLWNPTQSDPNELNALAKSVKDEVDVNEWKKNNSKNNEPKEVQVISKTEGKVNYLLKSLERVP